MRRYEGFLRPGNDRPRWPGRIWIVAVKLGAVPTYESMSIRYSTLSEWSAVVLDCDGPRCSGRVLYHGRTAGEFWDCFLRQSPPSSTLWAVSPRALMAWQTLGVWQEIESGRVSVLPVGPAVTAGVAGGRGAKRSPLLLTNDPPTAGYFRHEPSELSWNWTCAGNYGLQEPHTGIDASAEAAALAGRVLSLLRLLSDHQLGGMGVTAGSIALAGWRSSYDGPPLYVPTGRSGDTLETRAVAGGLLFARPTGVEPVTAYAVDCRSMYPYICTHYPQGTDLLERDLRGSASENAVRACPLAALAEVDVSCPEPRYPQQTTTGVVYPAGEFRTVLCGPELQEVFRHGHIKRVYRCNVYRLGTPLADYERRCWAARLACAAGEYGGADGFIKRLGVSLIGKMAQRSETWAEVAPDINDPLWGSWTDIGLDGRPRQMRARAGIVEAETGRELCSHSIMSIALWVWSQGRVKLWEWIEAAGRATVLYADTDGILLDAAGYESLRTKNMLHGESWGTLRHVAGPLPCTVRGLKRYIMGDKVIQAGYPMNQRESPSQFGEQAWYRLPWDRMRDPGTGESWIERMR